MKIKFTTQTIAAKPSADKIATFVLRRAFFHKCFFLKTKSAKQTAAAKSQTMQKLKNVPKKNPDQAICNARKYAKNKTERIRKNILAMTQILF